MMRCHSEVRSSTCQDLIALFLWRRCGLVCSDLGEVRHSEAALSPAQAERIVGWALSLLLSSDAQAPPPPPAASSRGPPKDVPLPLPLPAACLQAALATHISAQVRQGSFLHWLLMPVCQHRRLPHQHQGPAQVSVFLLA